MYDLGDSVVFSVVVSDESGVATDPATLVLTLVAPDGTATTPTPQHPSLGTFTYTVVPTQAGQWRAVWTASDPTASYVEVAQVRPSTDFMLISLDDARAHLNLAARASDEELREQILVASSLIQDLIGPVLPTTRSQTCSGSRTILPLDHRVVSVTTVTQHPGGVVPASDGANRGYRLVGDRGLELVSGMTPVPWASRVTVAYVAGYSTVPPTIRQAARELVRHLWDTQRGPSAPRSMENETWMSGQGFTLPRRVVELLNMTPAAV
jgi:hypothetical protein